MVKLARRPSPSKGPAPSASAFRKYTNLAALIHLLQAKEITLLDPASWDDKNDAYYMSQYKDVGGFNNVFAICFAQSEETYHHWRVYAPGIDGVCIEFDKDAILSSFGETDLIRKKPVSYRLIKTLKSRARIDLEDLPFLKRKPYEPECEYRVVYADRGKEVKSSQSFPIASNAIRRITLSPWMHESLRSSVRKTLQAIPGWPRLKVSRSTLVGNREWQALAEKVRADAATSDC